MRGRGTGIRWRWSPYRALGAAALGMVLGVAPLVAQADRGPRLATREELTRLMEARQDSLAMLQKDDREEAMASVAAISRRLREGDVWPGDIVRLRVLGEDRWTLDHTVTPMRTIALEGIDPIDVSGALYSELEQRIAESLSRYLREPRIEVDVLKRVGVLGNVGNPGFYLTTGNSLVSELIMQAGGPAANANVDKIVFRRLGDELDIGPQVVWQSMSLDDLGLLSGDEVYVPQSGSRVGRFLLGTIGVVGTVSFIMWRIFR